MIVLVIVLAIVLDAAAGSSDQCPEFDTLRRFQRHPKAARSCRTPKHFVPRMVEYDLLATRQGLIAIAVRIAVRTGVRISWLSQDSHPHTHQAIAAAISRVQTDPPDPGVECGKFATLTVSFCPNSLRAEQIFSARSFSTFGEM